MEKNFRKNPDKANMVSDADMTNITTEQRIDTWVNSQPVGLAFERLRQIVKEKKDKRMLFIKYEDLTKNPTREIQKVYKYLEIDEYEHDFDNVEQTTKEDDEVYGVFGDHKIQNKVTSKNPDYREILGVNTSNWIKQNYSWFYEIFNY